MWCLPSHPRAASIRTVVSGSWTWVLVGPELRTHATDQDIVQVTRLDVASCRDLHGFLLKAVSSRVALRLASSVTVTRRVRECELRSARWYAAAAHGDGLSQRQECVVRPGLHGARWYAKGLGGLGYGRAPVVALEQHPTMFTGQCLKCGEHELAVRGLPRRIGDHLTAPLGAGGGE